MNIRKTYGTALFVVSLCTLSLFFYRDTIQEFPSHIHAWSQADRYALSLGFLSNGFDLFHPETYNLNPQFPAATPPEPEQGITAVDFPLHDYIAALLMSLFRTSDPWVFRSYILACSLAGLIFLFLLAKALLKSVAAGALLALFAFTSPVLTYYQAGFLPTIPALACFFAGLYFFSVRNTRRSILAGRVTVIVLFTLAALVRTPFVIPLIALAMMDAVLYVRNKHLPSKIAVFYLFSFAVIVAYVLYNRYLRLTYGSVFLSHPMPPTSFSNLIETITYMIQNWGLHYFTVWHYGFLVFVLSFSAVIFVLKPKRVWPGISDTALFFLLTAGGMLFYALMMARQFKYHDYYFLDTLFPVAVLFIVLCIRIIQSIPGKMGAASLLLLCVFLPGAVIADRRIQKERRTYSPWDKVRAASLNFSGADVFLDDLNISRDARILAPDAFSPNIPFILMDRKGYSVLQKNPQTIENALAYPFDYMVGQDAFLLTEVVPHFPGIINRMECIAGNGTLSVYRLLEKERPSTVAGFMGFSDKEPVAEWRIASAGKAIPAGDTTCMEKRRWRVGAEEEFTVLISDTTITPLSKTMQLFVEGRFSAASMPVRASVIASSEKIGLYHNVDLRVFGQREQDWNTMAFLIPLPDLPEEGYPFRVYIWNPAREILLFEDVRIYLYQR